MKVIHYINQFFAGIGGEDMADQEPIIKEELVGPAMALDKVLDADVTHTLICGDNFLNTNQEEAIERILGLLEGIEFDMFIAGPTFQAGRYGVAAGTVCKAVQEKYGVPVITSMHEENPGVLMFKKDMVVFKGANNAGKMRHDVKAMAKYANKIINGEKLLPAEEEGYFGRGIRSEVWLKDEVMAADRGVDMLIKKLNGEAYQTELPVPERDVIPMAEPVADLSKAKIAVLTTGGIVPVDNPDRIQSASATRWGKYDMTGMDALKGGEFKTIHAGFDPAAANADPNVIVPLDALRDLEKSGKFGELERYFFTTVGTGTTQAEAERMATEIVEVFKEEGVTAAIMTST